MQAGGTGRRHASSAVTGQMKGYEPYLARPRGPSISRRFRGQFVADIIISIVVSLFTEPKPAAELVRLWPRGDPEGAPRRPTEGSPWYAMRSHSA